MKILSILFLILLFSSCANQPIEVHAKRVPSSESLNSPAITCGDIFKQSFIKDLKPRSSNFFTRFLKKEEESPLDVHFLQLLDLELMRLSESPEVLSEKFKEYATKNGIKYLEIEDGFKILPDKSSSKLNAFIYSVNQKKGKDAGKEIEFVFIPKEAPHCVGAYEIKKTRIHLSLKSIFYGEPTNIEVHEFMHFENERNFRLGNNSFFRTIVTPFRNVFVMNPKFHYASGFMADELLTHVFELKLLRKYYRLFESMNKVSRELLTLLTKNKAETIYHISSMMEYSLKNILEQLAKSSKGMRIELAAFSDGKEYVKVTYTGTTNVTFQWIDNKAVSWAKLFLNSNDNFEKDEAYQRLYKRFVLQAETLFTSSHTLVDSSKRLVDLTDEKNFRASGEFFDLLSDIDSQLETLGTNSI